MSGDPGYFLYHSIGLYPGKAEAMASALGEFATGWGAADDGQWSRALAAREGFLAGWRALIEAPEGSLTAAENVTAALHSAVTALPARRLRGRSVLVAADCFPSLHFLLAGLAERLGFTLHTVPPRPGEAWVRDEDVIAAWGEEVGLALLTCVTSTASHRPDLAALCAHGRRMGSLVALDLTQGAGLLPFAVADDRPDIVVSTSLKWICGTPGAGILYVRPELLAECRPELRGWFSQADPFSWDLDAFAYAPDARRFDGGTPSVLACVGSVPALRWTLAQEPGAALVHARALGRAILEGARALGLPPACPLDEVRRGGSVMLRVDGDPERLVAALRAEALHADARGPVLRLSPGAVTTEAHVERLLGALRRHAAG